MAERQGQRRTRQRAAAILPESGPWARLTRIGSGLGRQTACLYAACMPLPPLRCPRALHLPLPSTSAAHW